MMADLVVVNDSQPISSKDSASAQQSLDFKDPLGVNDHHLCAAVDDESDEFDFDVSLPFSSLTSALLAYL